MVVWSYGLATHFLTPLKKILDSNLIQALIESYQWLMVFPVFSGLLNYQLLARHALAFIKQKK